MHQIVLSIHPHIVEGSRSHGHGSLDMASSMTGCLCPHRYCTPPRPKGYVAQLGFCFACPAHARHRSSLVFLGVVGLAMAIYMAGCCCGSRYARRFWPRSLIWADFAFFLPARVPHIRPLALLMFGRSSLGYMASSLAGAAR